MGNNLTFYKQEFPFLFLIWHIICISLITGLLFYFFYEVRLFPNTLFRTTGVIAFALALFPVIEQYIFTFNELKLKLKK